MKDSNLFLKAALASVIAVGAVGVSQASLAGNMGASAGGPAHTKILMGQGYQQCFGVNAAYKNDCQSPGHSCAGQDSKVRDPNAFVLLPAGLCSKIAGGHTKSM